MVEIRTAVFDGENMGYDDETNEADFSIRGSDGQTFHVTMHELDFSEFVVKVMALHRHVQDVAHKAGLGPPTTFTRATGARGSSQEPACIGIEVFPEIGPMTGYFLHVDDAERLAHQILKLVPDVRSRLNKIAN